MPVVTPDPGVNRKSLPKKCEDVGMRYVLNLFISSFCLTTGDHPLKTLNLRVFLVGKATAEASFSIRGLPGEFVNLARNMSEIF